MAVIINLFGYPQNFVDMREKLNHSDLKNLLQYNTLVSVDTQWNNT